VATKPLVWRLLSIVRLLRVVALQVIVGNSTSYGLHPL